MHNSCRLFGKEDTYNRYRAFFAEVNISGVHVRAARDWHLMKSEDAVL